MFKLNSKFDADSLLCSLSHFECDGHTAHMLTQWCLQPMLTGTVKSSLFTHAHSSPLSLAARLHRCHANCSCYINKGHVDCFLVLAIMNNAAVNVRVQMSLKIVTWFPLDIYPGNPLSVSMVEGQVCNLAYLERRPVSIFLLQSVSPTVPLLGLMQRNFISEKFVHSTVC